MGNINSKKINFLRIITIFVITITLIMIMEQMELYNDYLIIKIQTIITISAAGVFCVCNYSNKSIICMKNMGIFICTIVAYVYSYKMNNIKYVIYIVLTIFVVSVALLIDKGEDKKDNIKKVCGQIFYMIRIILVPSIFQILNSINIEARAIVCVMVVILYSKLYKKILKN